MNDTSEDLDERSPSKTQSRKPSSAKNKKKRKYKKRNHYTPTLKEVTELFKYSLSDASEKLNISVSKMKKICREYGIHKWPFKDRRRVNIEEVSESILSNANKTGSPDAERNELYGDSNASGSSQRPRRNLKRPSTVIQHDSQNSDDDEEEDDEEHAEEDDEQDENEGEEESHGVTQNKPGASNIEALVQQPSIATHTKVGDPTSSPILKHNQYQTRSKRQRTEPSSNTSPSFPHHVSKVDVFKPPEIAELEKEKTSMMHPSSEMPSSTFSVGSNFQPTPSAALSPVKAVSAGSAFTPFSSSGDGARGGILRYQPEIQSPTVAPIGGGVFLPKARRVQPFHVPPSAPSAPFYEQTWYPPGPHEHQTHHSQSPPPPSPPVRSALYSPRYYPPEEQHLPSSEHYYRQDRQYYPDPSLAEPPISTDQMYHHHYQYQQHPANTAASSPVSPVARRSAQGVFSPSRGGGFMPAVPQSSQAAAYRQHTRYPIPPQYYQQPQYSSSTSASLPRVHELFSPKTNVEYQYAPSARDSEYPSQRAGYPEASEYARSEVYHHPQRHLQQIPPPSSFRHVLEQPLPRSTLAVHHQIHPASLQPTQNLPASSSVQSSQRVVASAAYTDGGKQLPSIRNLEIVSEREQQKMEPQQNVLSESTSAYSTSAESVSDSAPPLQSPFSFSSLNTTRSMSSKNLLSISAAKNSSSVQAEGNASALPIAPRTKTSPFFATSDSRHQM